jgi:hypothetical protein
MRAGQSSFYQGGKVTDTVEEQSKSMLDGIKLEYPALRSEISQRIGLRQQLIAITLTIAGVILSFGVSNGSIALVYPPLAVFLAYAWIQNDLRIRDTAIYIREQIEPKLPGLNWETFVQNDRASSKNIRWRRTVLSHGGIFLFTQLIAVLVGVINFRFSPLEWSLLTVDVIAVIFVLRIMGEARR